jgi:cysteine desulfurase
VLEVVPAAPRIPVDADGVVRLDALEDLLDRHQPGLVAVMAANNETGVLQPIPEIAHSVHRRGALLHVDAVQQFGRLPFMMSAVGADFCALSAHKLGGPPGVGALVLRGDPPFAAQILGGGQERRRRAGTENVPGVVGFAAALGLATDWDVVRRLRDRLETEVLNMEPDAVVVGASAPRLPGTSCLVTPGLAAEIQLMAFDLEGVAVSSGAACSSGKVAASHVLHAMGMSHGEAACAIRISLGWASVPGDVDRFLEVYASLLRRRRVRRAVA